MSNNSNDIQVEPVDNEMDTNEVHSANASGTAVNSAGLSLTEKNVLAMPQLSPQSPNMLGLNGTAFTPISSAGIPGSSGLRFAANKRKISSESDSDNVAKPISKKTASAKNSSVMANIANRLRLQANATKTSAAGASTSNASNKKKIDSIIKLSVATPLPLSNKFEQLAEGEITETQSKIDNTDTEARSRPPRVPGIALMCENRVDVCGKMLQLGIDFSVRHGIKSSWLKPRDSDEWSAIMDFCKTNNHDGYSHNETTVGQLHVAVYEVPGITVDILREALVHAKKQPIKITEFGKNPVYRNYAVSFPKKLTTLADLNADCSKLGHLLIHWVKNDKPKRGPIMCFRCLMYGHGQQNCLRQPICAECGAGHHTSQCTNKQETVPIIRCANCAANNEQHEHMATDENCPTRLKFLQRRAKKRTTSASVYSGKKQISFNALSHTWPELRANMSTRALDSTTSVPLPRTNDIHSLFAAQPANKSNTSSTSAANSRSRSRTRSHQVGPVASQPCTAANFEWGQQASSSNGQAANGLRTLPELIQMLVAATERLLGAQTADDQLRVMLSILSEWVNNRN